MLRRIAGFLVRKRVVIATIATVLAIGALWLIPLVNVNYDMTRYLPADSSMKAGLDIIDAEFPDADSCTLRVMFKGLPDSLKTQMKEDLAALPDVDSVAFEAGSSDYNKDGYTLYELTVPYPSDSTQVQTLEDTITQDWGNRFSISYAAGEKSEGLPLWIIGLAMAIVVVILLVMCHSWIEPFLFLITIGLAVALNMGTNAFLSSISSSTWMISAILQLALSMDYSIMLINRYRQELPGSSDNCAAMTEAIVKAIPAILSASLTTFVGLLALVFMSFRIGADLGFVLAKGVLCSLVYVFAVLPALIIACDKLIKRSEKPTFHFNLNGLGHFSYRFRYAIAIVFVALFVVVFIYRGNTPISYVLNEKTAVDEVFPAGSTTVLVYSNDDEAAADTVAAKLETTDGVKSVTSYSGTIGKRYTVDELAVALADSGLLNGTSLATSSSSTSSKVDAAVTPLETSLLKMVYYDYYKGDDVPPMTVHDFAAFVVDMAADNTDLLGNIDQTTIDELRQLVDLTDPDALSEKRTSAQMAEFLGIDQSVIDPIYLLYFGQNSDSTSVTLKDFVDFLVDKVTNDPTYSSYLDDATVSNLEQLRSILDAAASGEALDADALAQATGMDATLIGQALTAAGQTSMTAGDFLGYVLDNFSSFLDADTSAKLTSLKQLVDAGTSGEALSSDQIASALGMDATLVKTLMAAYQQAHGDTSSWTLSVDDLMSFLTSGVTDGVDLSSVIPADTLNQVQTLATIVGDAASGTTYTPEQIVTALDQIQGAMATLTSSSADSTGSSSASGSGSTADSSSATGSDSASSSGATPSLTSDAVSLVYLYHAAMTQSDPTWTLSLDELFSFLTDTIENDTRFSSLLDADTRTKIDDAAKLISAAYGSLVGSGHSRLVVETSFSSESDEGLSFVSDLDQACSEAGMKDYHLVGTAAMAYEMSQTFSAEQNLILLITAMSIFIVVALTFRSLLIPLILVALIQCGVFATVVIIGLQGSSIYYLALLIVQSILMGATIDYAILYTTYYREKRATLSVREALGAAYNGSIETILTSGSILVLVTWLLSYAFSDPSVGEICLTISKGTCCALVMIIFILPGLLAVCDRLICRKRS